MREANRRHKPVPAEGQWPLCVPGVLPPGMAASDRVAALHQLTKPRAPLRQALPSAKLPKPQKNTQTKIVTIIVLFIAIIYKNNKKNNGNGNGIGSQGKEWPLPTTRPACPWQPGSAQVPGALRYGLVSQGQEIPRPPERIQNIEPLNNPLGSPT